MNHDEISNLFFKMIADVKALIGEAVEAVPNEVGMGTALGGTSVALAECAYQLGMDKETLKLRLMDDIDDIYARAESLGLQRNQLQHKH